MMARHRGDLCVHTRRRPIVSAAAPTRPPAADSEEILGAPEVAEHLIVRQPRPSAFVAVATVIAIAVIAAQQHAGQAAAPRLPSSAQQWADQWVTASLRDPTRGCGQLFAPARLRAPEVDRMCSAHDVSVTIKGVRVRHVLEAGGGAAAVEAQRVSVGRRRDLFTIVLRRVRGGWQAVDVVTGDHVGHR